jgi:hypothetical protein
MTGKMPTNLVDLDMAEGILLDNIHHALKIIEKWSRYSVLKHCNVSNSDLKRAIKDIGY